MMASRAYVLCKGSGGTLIVFEAGIFDHMQSVRLQAGLAPVEELSRHQSWETANAARKQLEARKK